MLSVTSAIREGGPPDPRRVFIVHGRNLAARDGVFTFLRSLGLDPIEWSQAIAMTGEASPYIGRVLDVALAAAQAIVVLMTPDEIAYLRTEYAAGVDDPETSPAAQARPNVLFEAGMAMGRDPDRTVLVELGRVRPFSDVAGRHILRLDGSIVATRHELAQRLKTAGCDVDTSGSHWLTAGDLTPPPQPGGGLPLGKRLPQSPNVGGPRLDARYHDRGNSNGRLEIINRGTEPIFSVNVTVPENVSFHLFSDELPIEKLPGGKSVMLLAGRFMGPGKSHFEIRVTAATGDGTPIVEDIFVSLVG
jgi:predicted nucleotide-binding protein